MYSVQLGNTSGNAILPYKFPSARDPYAPVEIQIYCAMQGKLHFFKIKVYFFLF